MADTDDSGDVLSSLPRSRPTRRSAKRDAARKPKAAPAKKGPAKTAAKAKPRATSKARTAKAPTVKRAARPSNATNAARSGGTPPRPAPSRESERDVVGTALEAAGEVARVGLTLGAQIVREATRRLPKP